jgi:hypothetical protein
VKFKANNQGFYDVRRMSAVRSILEHHADRVADRANSEINDIPGFDAKEEHYGVGSQQGRKRPEGRWRASVFTKTSYAQQKDAEDNILLRALHGG